jgi:hypothetical protein
MKLNKFREKLATENYNRQQEELQIREHEKTLKIAMRSMARAANDKFGFGRKRTNILIKEMAENIIKAVSDDKEHVKLLNWCNKKRINTGG